MVRPKESIPVPDCSTEERYPGVRIIHLCALYETSYRGNEVLKNSQKIISR